MNQVNQTKFSQAATKLSELRKSKKVASNNTTYNLVSELIINANNGIFNKLSTVTTKGRGKYSHYKDITSDVSNILTEIGISFITGNDHPSLAKKGCYIVIEK